MKINLNQAELAVLQAMVDNAESCAGGDFGIMEELSVEGMSRRALGGYVSILAQKGLVTVHETMKVNGTDKVTQFTLDESVQVSPEKYGLRGKAPVPPCQHRWAIIDGLCTGCGERMPEAPVVKEPSLAKRLLVQEREIKLAEYRHAISRATALVNDTVAKLGRGQVSTHDGFNLGGAASDLQALAAVIESLDRCLLGCE